MFITYKTLTAPGITSIPLHDGTARYELDSTLASSGIGGLEPYSVVIENSSHETIIAYVLRVTTVDSHGATKVRERIFHNFNLYPKSGVRPNGMEISPNTVQIVTPTISVRGAPTVAIAPDRVVTNGVSFSEDIVVREFESQAGAVVSLDLVVFESGRVVGPDEGSVSSFVQAHFSVEKQLAQLLDGELRAAKTLAHITALLNERAAIVPRSRVPGAEVQYWHDFVSLDLSRFYLYKARISREELAATVAFALNKRPIALGR